MAYRRDCCTYDLSNMVHTYDIYYIEVNNVTLMYFHASLRSQNTYIKSKAEHTYTINEILCDPSLLYAI